MSKSNHNEDKFASKANRASKYEKKTKLSKFNSKNLNENEYFEDQDRFFIRKLNK